MKKYFVSVIEECIMNKEYEGFAGGRIEVYGNNPNGYANNEFRFMFPQRFWSKIREVIDFTDWTEDEMEKSYIRFEGKEAIDEKCRKT